MDDKKTITQVAKKAGLSIATVSRVLNNHPYVKEITKEKVLQAIAQLGFERNNIASGLRSKHTNTVGMIVPRISMFFHAEVITTVQRGLEKWGMQLMICQSADQVESEKSIVRTLLGARVDAVIVASTLYTEDFGHFDILTQNNIPVLFYDRVPMLQTDYMHICGDDLLGGYLAATHVLEKGCVNIARISGPLTCSLYYNRLAGFEKAMREKSIKIQDRWIFQQELTYENAMIVLAKIFADSNDLPDAIICDNDTTAIATVEFAKQNNISIPHKLKVVGYSNDPRSAIITPSITTINQFPTQMGEKILEELKSALREKNIVDKKKTEVIMPVALIQRAST